MDLSPFSHTIGSFPNRVNLYAKHQNERTISSLNSSSTPEKNRKKNERWRAIQRVSSMLFTNTVSSPSLPPPFYSNNQYNRDGTSQRVSGEKESNLLPRDTTGLTTRYKKKKKKKEKSARPTQFKPQPNAKSPVTRRSKRFQAVLSLPSFSRLRFQKRAALPLPCFSFPRRTLTREETTENPFLSSSSSSSEKRGGNWIIIKFRFDLKYSEFIIVIYT